MANYALRVPESLFSYVRKVAAGETAPANRPSHPIPTLSP